MGESTLKTLLAFVRQFEMDAPLERGVQHLVLRSLAKQSGSLRDLLEWIEAEEFEMAEQEIVIWHQQFHDALVKLDILLATETTTPDEIIAKAIADRLSALLDRIITASVQRLPAELMHKSVKARVLRENFMKSYHTWQNIREELLKSRRELELVVADLARAYERRSDIEKPRAECEGVIQLIQANISTTNTLEKSCVSYEDDLKMLHEETFLLNNKAHSVITELSRIRAAAKIFEVSLTQEVNIQMREWEDRLNGILDHISSDFEDFPKLVRDQTLVQAIDDVNILVSRVQQILNPIRPSVFGHPLDRPEELRRLALITLCVYTNRQDAFNPRVKHKGIGKRTTNEILVLADLIDQTETEQVSTAIFFFQTNEGSNLAEKERRGKWWFYRITQAGVEQAEAWFDETLDSIQLKARIEHAIKERRVQKINQVQNS